MYILANAVKNIGRNKGRNILLAVIIFAVILATAVSIIINTTTGAIIRDYKARFGSEVFITLNYGKMINFGDLKPLTMEQQVRFGESDLLQSKEFTASVGALPKDLKVVNEDKLGQGGNGTQGGSGNATTGEIGLGGTSGTEQGNAPLSPSLIRIIGSTRDDISDDFKRGQREIINGEKYKDEDECIVSEAFAELNHLSVGDTIQVESRDKDKPMTHTLTVTGIYRDDTMVGQEELYSGPTFNRNNEILVSFDTATKMDLFQISSYTESKYYLKSPELLEDFQKELSAKGLPDFYKVSTDEAGYNRIVGPVEGLTKITNTFLIAVLVLGSVILIILSTLAIRERKYEIGVLRAMGMKKGKVALGLLCEMIFITVFCLALGLGVGAAASQPVANTLLKSQIEIAENNNNGIMTAGDLVAQNSSAQANPLSELRVSLNMDAVGQIALISLLLAGVSSFAGILYITKFEPMKILSERN